MIWQYFEDGGEHILGKGILQAPLLGPTNGCPYGTELVEGEAHPVPHNHHVVIRLVGAWTKLSPNSTQSMHDYSCVQQLINEKVGKLQAILQGSMDL